MAWLPAIRGKGSSGPSTTPTTYIITTTNTGGTTAAIRVEKTNDTTTINDIEYTAVGTAINFGDILVDYGTTASGKWTVKVNGDRTVIYNNTEYKNGAVIVQWNYYTSINYIFTNEQAWKYNPNGYYYNIVTKSATSSSAIITVNYYNNGALVSSTDVTTSATSSNPVYIGNIKIVYSSPNQWYWHVFTRYSDTIIDYNGMYTTSTANLVDKWMFSTTTSRIYRECS